MKETVVEAAKRNILFNYRTVDVNLGGSLLAEFGKDNFISGAEWQAKQSPWISVEEIPPMDTPLFLRYGDGGMDDYDVGEYSGHNYYNKHGQVMDDYVTHWMPIPEFD